MLHVIVPELSKLKALQLSLVSVNLGSVEWTDAVLHISIVALAVVVLTLSVMTFARRKSRRYLFLSIAFLFIFLSQFSTLLEVLFLSNALILIPVLGLHLSHVFDFLTLVFFILALTGFGQNKRIENVGDNIDSKVSKRI